MKRIYYTLFTIVCILFHFKLYSQSQCYDTVTIYTPNYTPITVDEWNYICTEQSLEHSNALADAAIDYWGSDHVQYVGVATRTYNCHGYAWHKSEGGDPYWMYTPSDDKYWEDGSYVMADSTEAEKISYGNCSGEATVQYFYCRSETDCEVRDTTYESNFHCDHSAIVADLDGYLISKWGDKCRFQHRPNDCPYLIEGGELRYFKRCREVKSGNITSDFTKEDCCEFILQNVTISNNADVVLKTKSYDDYKEIDEYIQINGPFEIQTGSTLKIQ